MKSSAVAAAAMILTATACGSSGSDTTAPAPAVACVAVDQQLLGGIADGGEPGAGLQAVSGAAVKSADFANVYFVAMKFKATGVADQIGVWATNSLSPGGGTIMAVDSFAQQFTVWPDADKTKAAIASNDPSVAAAKACL